jgi:hypothetical protein
MQAAANRRLPRRRKGLNLSRIPVNRLETLARYWTGEQGRRAGAGGGVSAHTALVTAVMRNLEGPGDR